jgi:hypothetical protein
MERWLNSFRSNYYHSLALGINVELYAPIPVEVSWM